MCVKLVINKNYTEMHGQRNIKKIHINCLMFGTFPLSNLVHHSSFIGTLHSSSTIFRFVD